MKITKEVLRRLIYEMNIPNPVQIDDHDELLFRIAMKAKDMMPVNEVLGLDRDSFEDMVVYIYETHFDPDKEGWAPYEEDLIAIEDHLTITPLPGDEDFDQDEHGQYYEEHSTRDYMGEQDGSDYSFRKENVSRTSVGDLRLRIKRTIAERRYT